ncbi:hypothetical protein EMEDMD4_170048 [Sinorhizobium medicae]|uniref:Uncharacterized protein n=1 Tax=Sinorhizobium medicae TaxID=110321 RepID=A0A508WTK8_9HYPH|nr:hypothetical protein EMEDMD4_170048 [Sinorhizobium medicae]
MRLYRDCAAQSEGKEFGKALLQRPKGDVHSAKTQILTGGRFPHSYGGMNMPRHHPETNRAGSDKARPFLAGRSGI